MAFQKYPNATKFYISASSTSYETVTSLYEAGGAVLQIFNNTTVDASYKINLYLTDSTDCQAYPIKTATTISASTYALDQSLTMPFYKADILISTTGYASTNRYIYQIDSAKYL